jgi:hypothetical protein
VLAIALEVGESLAPSVFDQRLEWGKFMKKDGGKREFFRRHLRMKCETQVLQKAHLLHQRR